MSGHSGAFIQQAFEVLAARMISFLSISLSWELSLGWCGGWWMRESMVSTVFIRSEKPRRPNCLHGSRAQTFTLLSVLYLLC